jgi:type II secretory pathway pseudopilin PulG
MGLIEVLVASALMAVALVVLLGSLSSLLLGSRVAERRTVEERLARAQIEGLMAQNPLVCPSPATQAVDHITYTIETVCRQSVGYFEVTVTVRDPSGGNLSLSNDRVGS